MAGQNVHVTGLTQKVRALERLGVDTQDMREAFGRISQGVVREARARVRVSSGALSGTIRPANTKNKSVVRAGTAAVDYAAVQNYDPDLGNEFLTIPANADTEEKARQIEAELRTIIRKYDL